MSVSKEHKRFVAHAKKLVRAMGFAGSMPHVHEKGATVVEAIIEDEREKIAAKIEELSKTRLSFSQMDLQRVADDVRRLLRDEDGDFEWSDE